MTSLLFWSPVAAPVRVAVFVVSAVVSLLAAVFALSALSLVPLRRLLPEDGMSVNKTGLEVGRKTYVDGSRFLSRPPPLRRLLPPFLSFVLSSPSGFFLSLASPSLAASLSLCLCRLLLRLCFFSPAFSVPAKTNRHPSIQPEQNSLTMMTAPSPTTMTTSMLLFRPILLLRCRASLLGCRLVRRLGCFDCCITMGRRLG